MGDRHLHEPGLLWNVAIAVAIYLVARPLLTVPYRWPAVGVITLSAVHVLLAGSELPWDILAAIACGFLAASSVLLALGAADAASRWIRSPRPAPDGRRRHRGPPGLRRRPGVPAVLRDHDRRRRPLRRKVLGREERSSDLLFRFYRWLRFRGLGDEAIASS